MQDSAGDVGQAVAVEVPHLDVDPGDSSAPSGPQGSGEADPGGLADPPLTAALNAADDVGQAVAVEVTHLDVDPIDRGAPRGPQRGGKVRSRG